MPGRQEQRRRSARSRAASRGRRRSAGRSRSAARNASGARKTDACGAPPSHSSAASVGRRRLVLDDPDASRRDPVGVHPLAHIAARARRVPMAKPPSTMAVDDLPPRRTTPTVLVGGVPVGSAHPVVVQSMTNTDTADADATAIQVAQLAHAGSELVRITVNNDEAAAGGARHPRQARRARRRRPAHRRLPLQRPPAAHEVPRGGGGARQVPHQPRQRRHEAARRAVRADHRGRDRERGAGPHRRELGLARPAAADRDDGCQRRARPSRPTAAR